MNFKLFYYILTYDERYFYCLRSAIFPVFALFIAQNAILDPVECNIDTLKICYNCKQHFKANEYYNHICFLRLSSFKILFTFKPKLLITGSGLNLMRIYAIAKKGVHNNNTVQFVTLYFIICIEFLSYLDVSFIHDHPLLY